MTTQEITKNAYEAASKKAKVTKAKMSENLEKWVVQKGGRIDLETGNIIDLSPNDEKLFEYRNEQLATLFDEDQTVTAYIKALRMQIAELTQSNAVLRGGKSDENLSFISDKQIRQNADFYFNWVITKETTKTEFRRVCSQTRLWVDEARKRLLFESPDIEAKYVAKRDFSLQLLQDEAKLKTFFLNKFNRLFENDNGSNSQNIAQIH